MISEKSSPRVFICDIIIMVGVDQAAIDDFVIRLQKLLEDRDLKGIQSAIQDAGNEGLWAQSVWPAFDAVGPFLKWVMDACWVEMIWIRRVEYLAVRSAAPSFARTAQSLGRSLPSS